uniref:Uncharacterized protein n=1 Tax=Anguilla anguilla TaxID=7936 RepID=A0A0E9W4R9_ANGAN
MLCFKNAFGKKTNKKNLTVEYMCSMFCMFTYGMRHPKCLLASKIPRFPNMHSCMHTHTTYTCTRTHTHSHTHTQIQTFSIQIMHICKFCIQNTNSREPFPVQKKHTLIRCCSGRVE